MQPRHQRGDVRAAIAHQVGLDIDCQLVSLGSVTEHIDDRREQTRLERSDHDGVPAETLTLAGSDQARVLNHALHT